MSGFAANSLSIAPVAILAPEPLPTGLQTILAGRTKVLAQFFDPNLVFVHDDAIDDALVAQYSQAIRNFLVDAKLLVGLTPETTTYLHSLVWVIPDSRGLATQPSTNPVTAGIANVSSMAVFHLRPARVDPFNTKWQNNTEWQAVLIVNHFDVSRAAVPIPPTIILTWDQLMSGFLAFAPLQAALSTAVFPAGALFCEVTASGLPISPGAAAATRAAMEHNPTVAGPSGYDAAADNIKTRRDARIKTSERDMWAMTAFRGMSDIFKQFASHDLPVFSEMLHAVRITLAQLLDCHLTDTELQRLVRAEMGSRGGVTKPNCTSVTVLEATKTNNFATMVETCTRLAVYVKGVYGIGPYESFAELNLTLIRALQPTTPGYPETEIGVTGAIDILNEAFSRLAYDPLLQSSSPKERWASVVANIRHWKVWEAAVTAQARLNSQALIRATLPKGNPNANANNPPGSGKNKRALAAIATADPATIAELPTKDGIPNPNPPRVPPRCRQQDNPDGCSFGAKCRFTHDAANKKKGRPNTADPAVARAAARTPAAANAANAAAARAAAPADDTA